MTGRGDSLHMWCSDSTGRQWDRHDNDCRSHQGADMTSPCVAYERGLSITPCTVPALEEAENPDLSRWISKDGLLHI